jgi:hypothetical protein
VAVRNLATLPNNPPIPINKIVLLIVVTGLVEQESLDPRILDG